MTYRRTHNPDPEELAHAAALSQSLASANHNAAQLSAALTRIAARLRSPARSTSDCGPGGCSLGGGPPSSSSGGGEWSGGAALRGGDLLISGTEAGATGAGSLGGLISSALGAALRGALRGDMQAARRGFAQSLIRGLTGQLGRGLGGGAFGGVLGGLFGLGLSMLAGRLLGGGRQALAPQPLAPLLHFPQLASLDYASNPASRLFGGRAVARGPAFRVEVAYREGAGDIVSAKVATKLGEVNSMTL